MNAEGMRIEERGVRRGARQGKSRGRNARAMETVTLPERVMLRAERPGTGRDSSEDLGMTEERRGRDSSSSDSLGMTKGKDGGMTEGKAVLKYFVPFKDFFGGWLVYELGGRLWRQYATPAEMRAAGVGFTEAI